jgi:2-C-methyl-D-erythritol 4-phosphate cytidylyltransferase
MRPQKPQVYVVVVAAGSGQRMGLDVPKTLLDIKGSPVVVRTVHPFLRLKLPIVVVVPEAYLQTFSDLLKPFSISVCTGGSTRSDSVRRGVRSIESTFHPAPNDVVLVHDGARCFVTENLIETVIQATNRTGAAVPSLPVIDTLKEVSVDTGGAYVIRTVDRTPLRAVQTPQGLKWHLMQEALLKQSDQGATDDVSMVEGLSRIEAVMGEENNIKLTTPVDLMRANEILARKEINPSVVVHV